MLVNNAGAGYAMPILDVDVEEAKQVYEVNITGCYQDNSSLCGSAHQEQGACCQCEQLRRRREYAVDMYVTSSPPIRCDDADPYFL